eukprot:5657387-Prymnesium_polylepis.1
MLAQGALDAAARLKSLRALASSDQQLTGLARSEFERRTQALQQRARQHRNAFCTLEALEREAVPKFVPTLCLCPDPSVPPAALRHFLGAYGALLTVLRRQPIALATLLHRSGGAAPSLAQLLLCAVYAHLWLPEEERAMVRAAATTLRLRLAERGPAAALEDGSLPELLISGFLRVMPGGAAWLQAAIGAELEQ